MQRRIGKQHGCARRRPLLHRRLSVPPVWMVPGLQVRADSPMLQAMRHALTVRELLVK